MLKNLLLLFVLIGGAVFAQDVNQYDEDGKRHGKWVAKYRNGNLYYEVTFNHGIPVGTERRYTEKGKQKIVMNHYGDGKQSAVFIYYDNGEDIEAMGKYYEKERDSLWRFFYKDSTVLKEEFYRKGVKHGKWVSYYENGNKVEEKEFDNGVQIGVFNQYFTNGQLKLTVPVVQDEWQGVLKTYYPNGNLASQGMYRSSFKEGKWTFFEANGKIEKVITYKRGVVICTTEEQFTYFDLPTQQDANGDMTELSPGQYGEPNEEQEKKIKTLEKYDENCVGTFTEFYETGKRKRTGFYVEGRKDSLWIYYNPSTKIDSTVSYQGGVKHGEFKTFHSNGQVKMKEYWLGGKRHGIRETYDSNGKLIRKEEFVNGVKKS